MVLHLTALDNPLMAKMKNLPVAKLTNLCMTTYTTICLVHQLLLATFAICHAHLPRVLNVGNTSAQLASSASTTCALEQLTSWRNKIPTNRDGALIDS